MQPKCEMQQQGSQRQSQARVCGLLTYMRLEATDALVVNFGP